jgi:hypothetical protein
LHWIEEVDWYGWQWQTDYCRCIGKGCMKVMDSLGRR